MTLERFNNFCQIAWNEMVIKKSLWDLFIKS